MSWIGSGKDLLILPKLLLVETRAAHQSTSELCGGWAIILVITGIDGPLASSIERSEHPIVSRDVALVGRHVLEVRVFG